MKVRRSVLGTVLERTLPWRAKSPARMFLRVAVPLMLAFAAYVVASEGLRGALALLPIAGAHLLVLGLAYPLWLRHRRRRSVAAGEVGGAPGRLPGPSPRRQL